MVHPSKPGNPPTLLDGLQQLLVYDLATGGQLSILTRLDRETSGLVLVAKHKAAATRLGKAMAERQFQKTYLAIVHGWPTQESFVIDAPILRKGEVEPSEIHVRQLVHPDGRPSRTECRVTGLYGSEQRPYSLIECRLITGRMHQIRVHLESIGHPIVGDKIYGHDGSPYLQLVAGGWSEQLKDLLRLDRHALHATRLAWDDHEWHAPLPEVLREFLKKEGEITAPLH